METPLFSFGVIADCQYADQDDNQGFSSDGRHKHDNRFRSSLPKLKEAIEFFNQQDLEFVVHLGDFVDNDIEKHAPPLLDIVNGSKAPVWHIVGNHEYVGEGSEQKILDLYGLENTRYTRTVGQYTFIVLDTNEYGVIKHHEGTPGYEQGMTILQRYIDAGAENAHPWNGGLGDEQLEWLAGEIQMAHDAGQKVIVLSHHPVFPFNGLTALNYDKILDVIDASPGITAYINGHNHFGAAAVRKGVSYVTMPAILQGDTNAYSVSNVYEDHIHFVSYGHAQDMWFEVKS